MCSIIFMFGKKKKKIYIVIHVVFICIRNSTLHSFGTKWDQHHSAVERGHHQLCSPVWRHRDKHQCSRWSCNSDSHSLISDCWNHIHIHSLHCDWKCEKQWRTADSCYRWDNSVTVSFSDLDHYVCVIWEKTLEKTHRCLREQYD